MTLESIGETGSYPINPRIARLFYLNGYTDMLGTSTLRIQRLMENAGLVAPTFELSTSKGLK